MTNFWETVARLSSFWEDDLREEEEGEVDYSEEAEEVEESYLELLKEEEALPIWRWESE